MRNVEELMQDLNNLMPQLSVCIICWLLFPTCLLFNFYDEYSRDEDDIHRNGIKCVHNEIDCEYI